MADYARPRPDEILKGVSVKHRVIRQSPDYPEYKDGEDVDVLCADANETARQIFHLCYPMVTKGWKIAVDQQGTHTHVDFLRDTLILRLDLTDTLDDYKQMILDGGGELGLRLLEWERYPAKEKHLKYVTDKICPND